MYLLCCYKKKYKTSFPSTHKQFSSQQKNATIAKKNTKQQNMFFGVFLYKKMNIEKFFMQKNAKFLPFVQNYC